LDFKKISNPKSNYRVLKNKKVLITAGPTWVPIDSVRVLGNIATGKTGIGLAKTFLRLGSHVTLLLGPVGEVRGLSGVRLLRYVYFDELSALIKQQLTSGHYDVLVHSAAVSDYQPKSRLIQKIESGLSPFLLRLFPAPKLIDTFRDYNPNMVIVGFKFEPEARRIVLFKSAMALMKRARLDMVVACRLRFGRYQAYIINSKEKLGPFLNREEMSAFLVRKIKEMLWKD